MLNDFLLPYTKIVIKFLLLRRRTPFLCFISNYITFIGSNSLCLFMITLRSVSQQPFFIFTDVESENPHQGMNSSFHRSARSCQHNNLRSAGRIPTRNGSDRLTFGTFHHQVHRHHYRNSHPVTRVFCHFNELNYTYLITNQYLIVHIDRK
jgi:hypothetical protein